MITCVGTLSQRKWDPQYRNEVKTINGNNETFSNLKPHQFSSGSKENASIYTADYSINIPLVK